MPYYVASRTKKDEETDNWVVQAGPFRKIIEAENAAKYATSFDKIRSAGGRVSVFTTTDLKLLEVEIPEVERLKIPNASWLYLHTDKTHNRPALGNINVRDIPKNGRYAVAADGFVLAAMPTDLDEGNYPGKDGSVHDSHPYPSVEDIIPADVMITTTFRMSTMLLNSALKRAEVFAREASSGVSLTVKREHGPSLFEMSTYKMSGSNAVLKVHGKSIKFGESLDLLPCFLDGDSVIEATFNVKYLLNALRGWKGHTQRPTHEFTQIHMTGRPHNPILVEPYPAPIAAEDERLPFVVIMPMSVGR